MERDTMIDLREEEPFKERLGDELRAAALRLDQAPTEAARHALNVARHEGHKGVDGRFFR